MKKMLCNLFGHWWKYYFSMSDSHHQRADIRFCKCCGDAQIYKRIIFPFEEKEEHIWMNMIGLTKKGSKIHYPPNMLK